MYIYLSIFMSMNKVNIADARANLSRHLERVEAGETILLCRRNVPIAEIRPLRTEPARERPVGIDRGMSVPDSFFEPLPVELLSAFGATDDESSSGSTAAVDAYHWTDEIYRSTQEP